MLEFLRIRNYALIDDLKINFGRSFNVLTGETGAGKSIIIGALNVILGEKASTDLVRTGEQKAVIEATFDVSRDRQLDKVLESSGIDHDASGSLIIRREINLDGKSKNYVNASPVPLQKLKEIGDLLVDIHGQHEHQSLLKVETHMDLIDRFGRLGSEKEKLSGRFRQYLELKNKLEKLQMNEQEKARMLELLKFSIEEIEKAGLKPGEDIELEKECLLLSNQEKIFQAIENGYSHLYSDEGSIYSKMGVIIDELSEFEKFDTAIVEMKQKLEDSFFLVEDVVSLLKGYKSGFNFSPGRLESVIERIELINKLKKKYGPSLEEVLLYREKCARDLGSIEQSEQEIEKTQKEIRELEKELNLLALDLSEKRKRTAVDFEKKIMAQLNELDMKKSSFKVSIRYEDKRDGIIQAGDKKVKLTEKGIDDIEFLISPNAGEELKPLRKIASGGEISRIMLALKIVLNEVD
ncbi:MAG: DNA repair protein RecN, partial [bacterium]|nr:DNA repair protein RecN [bacterium]